MNKTVEDKRIDTYSNKDAYLINGKKEKKRRKTWRENQESRRVSVHCNLFTITQW